MTKKEKKIVSNIEKHIDTLEKDLDEMDKYIDQLDAIMIQWDLDEMLSNEGGGEEVKVHA